MIKIPRDIVKYHTSTARELEAVKNRVRNLIDQHWSEDGRHKEAILKNVIRKFLPKRYDMGTGFVVKREEDYSLTHKHSSQIDLIIYDTSFPLLFSESDFIITTPESIRGIIEVKTNAENQNLGEIIEKANQAGLFIYAGKSNKSKPLFNGIFSYDGFEEIGDTPNTITDRLEQQIIETFNQHIEKVKPQDYLVNHISLNKDIFLKHWFDHNRNCEYSIYSLEGLSFAYFISNLIYSVTDENLQKESSIWFPKDKELRRIHKFKVLE